MKYFLYLCPIAKSRLAKLGGDQQLTDEGLIIQEGEEYRLNDVYIAMKLRARKKINEKINEKIKLTDRQKMDIIEESKILIFRLCNTRILYLI